MKQFNVREDRKLDKLVEGFMHGDRVSIKKIYEMNFPSVKQYIQKNSGDASDAEDIYQEAITAAWINVREGKFSPREPSSLGGYIFQISRFKWLDKIKSKTHRATLYIADEAEKIPEENQAGDMDFQEERLEKLNSLYQHLTDNCKSILKRYYYEKKSLEEIGSELGYDSGTVKTLKYRCMKKLRELHTNDKA